MTPSLSEAPATAVGCNIVQPLALVGIGVITAWAAWNLWKSVTGKN